jgi:hypothetical protein
MVTSLKIENLRGIKEGELTDLAPLSILVGPNGSGKSTVLEGLFIGTSIQPAISLRAAVQRRAGSSTPARWLFWRGGQGREEARVTVRFRREFYRRTTLSRDPDDERAIKGSVDVAPTQSWSNVGNFFLAGDAQNCRGDSIDEEASVPDVCLLDEADRASHAPLDDAYSRAVKGGRRRDALQAVQALLPTVQAVEILTEGGKPEVHLVFEEFSVPAGMAGEGIAAVLREALELVRPPDSLVLLEEPEVHKHPAAMVRSAKSIFEAVRRGVQVVLTTHSIEFIDRVLAEAQTNEELSQIAIYRVALRDGALVTHRDPGTEAAFLRETIAQDLR